MDGLIEHLHVLIKLETTDVFCDLFAVHMKTDEIAKIHNKKFSRCYFGKDKTSWKLIQRMKLKSSNSKLWISLLTKPNCTTNEIKLIYTDNQIFSNSSVFTYNQFYSSLTNWY